jgi:hypothetical protein
LGFFAGDGPDGRPHRLGETGEDLGVDAIGFGESAGGPGEIAGLTGVEHRHRHPCGGQSGGQGTLEATGSLKDHQRRRRCLLEKKPADERVDTGLVVGEAPARSGGSKGYVQTSLGDVHPHINL